MGVATKTQHIMQTIDWKRFTLEEWLYQFGAWQYSSAGTMGKSINPIAVAMDEAVVKRKKFKLGVRKTRQVVSDYLMSGEDAPIPVKNKDHVCQITDDEARAVQRLILDMQGKSEVLDEWLDAVVDRYFYGKSWSKMVIKVGRVNNPTILRTEMDAKYDVKCGLAALHVRYPFITYGNKQLDLDQGKC